ncbi:MAG: pseudouridine synthase [Patescibacteria group bacterium]|jgi:pseudouridine synthase
MEKINLTKFIADQSNYSRRQAESLIRKGLIRVNGRIAELGEKVDLKTKVEIDGKEITPSTKKIYLKLNKPVGYVCSNKFFKGEQNIFSLINIKDRLFSIGRLDKDSCGLILLTNDGDLTYKLTHPKFEHQKTYLIVLERDANLKNENNIKKIENRFKSGIDIGEKTLAKVKRIEFLSENEVKIVLTEGKKRQIREMFKFFELKIIKLQRINFAGIELGSLEKGKWEYLNNQEIELLKNKK